MKLFTIDEKGKFIHFNEQDFKIYNKEIDLETLLEINPEYFFEYNKILIIGRQVATNLNRFIDLLGVDKNGNTVVIELKREKTPRETLAQLLEYASFIDNLDYDQLNEIFQDYSGEESNLDDYHKEFFELVDESSSISWNKSSKLVIVAQEITADIKQTSLFLRKKGLDIYCLEFKYFVNKENNRIISSDFVIGDETFIRQKVSSTSQLPKTTKADFLSNLDENGRKVFSKLFDFIERAELSIRWGSKGFSANVINKSEFVGIFFGWPSNSPWGQTIVTGIGQIEKKLQDSQPILDYFKKEISNIGSFNDTANFFGSEELKWNITHFNENETDEMIQVFQNVVEMVRKEMINREDNK